MLASEGVSFAGAEGAGAGAEAVLFTPLCRTSDEPGYGKGHNADCCEQSAVMTTQMASVP